MKPILPFLFFMGIFFLICCAGIAGSLDLHPPIIDNGGVALLQWQGEEPLSARAHFNGQTYTLAPIPQGAATLLGADLDLKPGIYPVEVIIQEKEGKKSTEKIFLEIRHLERPEERITLPSEMVTPQDPDLVSRILEEQSMLKKLFSLESETILWDTFRLPVPDSVGSVFGLQRILNGKPRSPHAGVDFRSPKNRKIVAASSGKVVFAGDLYFSGRTVILDHGQGLFTLYAHLEKILCDVGDLVGSEDLVGLVGSTGRSTGAHLHWGVKLRGDRIDPIALVKILGERRFSANP